MHIKSNSLINLKKGKTLCVLCVHLVEVIILQGIVLFQSSKFYDDDICKQAKLSDTDLLVLDVIGDNELSVTVVNVVSYISGYILRKSML